MAAAGSAAYRPRLMFMKFRFMATLALDAGFTSALNITREISSFAANIAMLIRQHRRAILRRHGRHAAKHASSREARSFLAEDEVNGRT